MIRKPDQSEFRESGTVSALRDAGTLAKEGARGVRDGSAKFVGWWLAIVMGFGFVMSVASSLGAVGMLVLGSVVIASFAMFRSRRSTTTAFVRTERSDAPLPEDMGSAESGRYDLSVAACGRAAAMLGIPAILLFPTSAGLSYMLPFTLGGIVMFAIALLLLMRLRGDRTILSYDRRAVTVRGLLGEATMLWEDVDDVDARMFSRLNLRVLFSSGGRRNVVISGSRNRLGGPATLLDKDGLITLVAALLRCRAGAPASPVTPRTETRTRPAMPAGDVVDGAFDPDAIMARYLTERDQVIAENRPDLIAPPRRASFGRRVA